VPPLSQYALITCTAIKLRASRLATFRGNLLLLSLLAPISYTETSVNTIIVCVTSQKSEPVSGILLLYFSVVRRVQMNLECSGLKSNEVRPLR
jgi:hypothetical protein